MYQNKGGLSLIRFPTTQHQHVLCFKQQIVYAFNANLVNKQEKKDQNRQFNRIFCPLLPTTELTNELGKEAILMFGWCVYDVWIVSWHKIIICCYSELFSV